MKRIEILLNESDFSLLNERYPKQGKSSVIGQHAESILKIYFKKERPRCTFETTKSGSDLKIVCNSKSFEIEIKGTAARNIAWNKLKVSSQKSHDRIVKGLPVYRVTDVFSKQPVLYILEYGIDFKLDKEPRWSFKKL